MKAERLRKHITTTNRNQKLKDNLELFTEQLSQKYLLHTIMLAFNLILKSIRW